MLNQVILVGRLVRDIEVNKSESGKDIATCTLAIPRPFKNKDGVIETDFIDCTLWNLVAINTSNYCKKGDIVGIKGRLQTKDVNLQDDKKRKVLQVIAEKVTFLSGHEKEAN